MAEGPAVVGADEGGGVAVFGPAQPVAPVSADVQERADLALPVAGDDDGVFAHVGSHEVAGVGNLGLVTQEEPATGENLLQLFLVYVLFAENPGADESPVYVNQRVYVCDDHTIGPPCVSYVRLVSQMNK